MNIPLGPVLVFAASNFPFAFGVLGTDTAAALAAGCAVVAKVHSGHPRLGERLADVMREALLAADWPVELFSLIEGHQNGVDVLRDDRIRAGAFTGSIPGGIALQEIAHSRRRPIPFFAEMGSVNPVIVTESAWMARRASILEGFVGSFTQSNGQLCTSPGLLFVPSTVGVSEHLRSVMGDAPAATMLTDAIADAFRSGTAALAETPGVSAATNFVPTKGRSASPVVWLTTTGVVADSPDILEERFGPSSVVIEYSSRADLESSLAHLGGQLTASVFSETGEDVSDIIDMVTQLAGRVIANSWPTGVAVSWSMHHGGPWPASSAIGFGSVGAESISRFLRPVTYQNFENSSLPPALEESNPWRIPRRVDGAREPVA